MKAVEFKAGELVMVCHKRRGQYNGTFVEANEKFFTVRVVQEVTGVSRSWMAGELLSTAWAMCDLVKKV